MPKHDEPPPHMARVRVVEDGGSYYVEWRDCFLGLFWVREERRKRGRSKAEAIEAAENVLSGIIERENGRGVRPQVVWRG